MTMITSAPMSNTNLPSISIHEKNSIPHLDSNASFSSYLHKKETFASKDPQGQLGIGSEKINKGEISIFAAEKYYNGGSDDGKKAETAKNHLRKHQLHHSKQLEGKAYIQNAKPKIGPGTPSTVSSASSWKSHKTLLPNPSKEKPRSIGNALNCKRLLAMFSCKCSCSDEKSVEVDETVTNKTTLSNCERNVGHGGNFNFTSTETTEAQAFASPQNQVSAIGTKQTEIQSEKHDTQAFELPKEDCFTFPVVSSGIDSLTIEKPVLQEEEGKDRKSLEVFGSPLSDDDGARALSLERRVAMLTLSFTKSMKGIAATSVNNGISDDEEDDLESDTSSDLFEIENFNNDTYPCYNPQQEENTSTSVTRAPYHQPREASIATENISRDSYYTEHNSSKKAKELAVAPKSVVVKKVHKRHLNALLSCSGNKAVNVAEVYKVSQNANSNHIRGCAPPQRTNASSYG
ncbi:hypothetical protein Scep_017384 [Stephania cephalantha]|uniref:Uncharacterized protein n=1 Tax=Stephania cephalantha TaxID=152367 RepID=A0AAP0NWV7_9MAGN